MATISFELIPAIDLKDGQCVRLKQGRMQDATVYGNDPAAMAIHWQQLGASSLHVVDLDGAFAGQTKNLQAIAAICAAIDIPVQLGGGLRSLAAIKKILALGVQRVILGSIAISNPALVHKACASFPQQICIGIDAKDGQVAVHGWNDITNTSAISLAQNFEHAGAAAIIYTDINRDGMLTGPNIEETANLAKAVRIPVIASGGIARRADVLALATHAAYGVCGAITGRAIYEGSLDFAATIRELQQGKIYVE